MDRSLDEILEERQVCPKQPSYGNNHLTDRRTPVADAVEDVAVLSAMVAVDPDETTNANATFPETA